MIMPIFLIPNGFLEYLSGIETMIDKTCINYEIEFLEYLSGIETRKASPLGYALIPFLEYLSGIETGNKYSRLGRFGSF